MQSSLVEAQAKAAGIPLWVVDLPWPCSNADYECIMKETCKAAVKSGIECVAFGDLFLTDIRAYREKQLENSGLQPIFPVWGMPTRELANSMIKSGMRAKLTCVDPKLLASAVVAYLPVPDLFGQALGLMARFIPPDSMGLVRRILADVVTPNRGAFLSFGILDTLWAASGGFSAAIEALNITYDVQDDRPFWKTRPLAVGLALTIGGLLLLTLAVMIVGPRFGEWLASRVHLSNVFVFCGRSFTGLLRLHSPFSLWKLFTTWLRMSSSVFWPPYLALCSPWAAGLPSRICSASTFATLRISTRPMEHWARGLR